MPCTPPSPINNIEIEIIRVLPRTYGDTVTDLKARNDGNLKERKKGI